ncbi:hypothetical protein F0562_019355 [Nyssa sinensis]|uniref:Histone-lysine N-methyltransferase n=1 Tax=Nyssa sinensis TaxID=561372 RepID=A0A5J4ZEK4_9ASTE|nr:hypothetical protein F0562_019355 [Nyssa sinensis]
MIVKRTMKFEMPNLKRCKVEDFDCEDDDACSVNPKKQKTNGYYSIPIRGFGQVHGEDVEDYDSIVNSWCTGVSCYAGEVESNSKNHRGRGVVAQSLEGYRPPLFKSSRGRVQVLPSRFNDSVIDSWKKDRSNDGETVMFNDERMKHGSPYCGAQVFKKRHIEDKFNFEKQKFNQFSVEAEEGEVGCTGFKDIDTKIYSSFHCTGLKDFEAKMYSSSHSSVTSINQANFSPLVETEEYPPKSFNSFTGVEKLAKVKTEKRKDFYRPEDFVLGDIVWAKSGRKYPAWPAIVIDPLWQAPETVLRACVPGTICVMFYGPSKNGRDYAWVKQGMIFPFLDYMDRFQRQTQLYWQQANEIQEDTGSNQDQECYSRSQDAYDKKKDRTCDSCDMILPCKTLKKTKGSTSEGQLLCEHCAKLRKSRQYCGICKKIWHHSDGGKWVCCDRCDVWVHADCANISNKLFKDLERIQYYCPECKAKSNNNLSVSEKGQSKVRSTENGGQTVLPDKITVVCTGMEGIYFPSLHLVQCKCSSCGTKKQTLGEWERHTGSRAKKWKVSVKVKGSMLPLEKLLTEYNAHGFNPMNLHKQQLFDFLREKYEPVHAKWTTERCAICRWVEDWDYNKIIICNRCQIAVHQECYGARNVQDFTSWVCRACETPDIERECCLCPVKGGALKPTDVDTLWVHVTCAWFRPEVAFLNDEKMEPAMGLLRIPSNSFVKICVICKQIHGSCTQCCKCATYFHAMCASRAGYRMELHCSEKCGRQITKWVSYCALHRC